MAKFWTRTDVFADGGRDFKHMQKGPILEGETADVAICTGMTWRWTMTAKREQKTVYFFGGEEFAALDDVIAAWHRACAADGH